MKLFISYAHDDKSFVQQLVDALRQADHDPWFDPHLVPGQEWQRELMAAIESCEVFIYALTPTSITSEWCQYELFMAVRLNKPIIPLLVKDADLPLILKNYQYADFREGISYGAMIALLNGIQNATKMRPITPPPMAAAATHSTQSRRLESAMPQQTTRAVNTEVWVKISLENSEGLRGQLPAVVASGDVIQKSDARVDTFPLNFKRDEQTGRLLPAAVCLKVTSDAFDARAENDHSHECGGGDGQIPLLVQPDYDSRTVVFELTPKAGQALSGRVRVTVHLYQDAKLIAQISVSTEIVEAIIKQESIPWTVLAESLLSNVSVGLGLGGELRGEAGSSTPDWKILPSHNFELPKSPAQVREETDWILRNAAPDAPKSPAPRPSPTRARTQNTSDAENSASQPSPQVTSSAPARASPYVSEDVDRRVEPQQSYQVPVSASRHVSPRRPDAVIALVFGILTFLACATTNGIPLSLILGLGVLIVFYGVFRVVRRLFS